MNIIHYRLRNVNPTQLSEFLQENHFTTKLSITCQVERAVCGGVWEADYKVILIPPKKQRPLSCKQSFLMCFLPSGYTFIECHIKSQQWMRLSNCWRTTWQHILGQLLLHFFSFLPFRNGGHHSWDQSGFLFVLLFPFPTLSLTRFGRFDLNQVKYKIILGN